MDPRLAAICSTYGVFLRREAKDLGYHDPLIQRMVDRGLWHRVRHGAYVFDETWRAASRAERYLLFVRATIRQSKTDVVASHSSAVAFNAGPLWGLDLGLSHLTRTDCRTGRKSAGVQQHHGVIEDGDVTEVGPFKVMTPTRAALETCTIGSFDAGVCVIDDFLHRGLTTRERLEARYATMERWPGSLIAPLVIRFADGVRESVGESRVAVLCWREHLPRPLSQVDVHDENGILIGRVDFAWPEYGVFLEFDGKQKYLKDGFRRPGETIEDVILREKHREDQICAITGWRCIRVTWADLERPGVLGLRIRNLLGV